MTSQRFITLLLLFGSVISYGQVRIKDGSTPADTSSLPGPNTILELSSSKRGVVFPRLALSYKDSAAPMSAHVQGMTVFNTRKINDVAPGLYVNDGTQWLALNGGVKTSVTGSANGVVKADPVTGKIFLKVGEKAFYAGFIPSAKGNALSNAANIPPLCLNGLITLDAWAWEHYYSPAVTNKTGQDISYAFNYWSTYGDDVKGTHDAITNQSNPNRSGPGDDMVNPYNSGYSLKAGKSQPLDPNVVYYNRGVEALVEQPRYYLDFKNPATNEWESYLVCMRASGSDAPTRYVPTDVTFSYAAPYIKVSISVERLE